MELQVVGPQNFFDNLPVEIAEVQNPDLTFSEFFLNIAILVS